MELVWPQRASGLENVFYGLGQWSIVAEAIIVVAAWTVVYNSFKPKAWLRYAKPVCVAVVLVLLVASILQDAFRQSAAPSQRSIFSTVYSVALLVTAIFTCAGFLIYGRRLYKSLSRFKNESSNMRHMRKLYSITVSVSVVAVVIAIVISIASFARIWFRFSVNYLAYAGANLSV